MFAVIREGYTGKSLGALAALSVAYALIILVWRDLFDFSTSDWLFNGIWIAMSAILCFRVDARRDVPRVVVGLVGGLAIEAWGTVTDLWTYSTHERPPFWIVPAWPVATLAIDRLAELLKPHLPKRSERLSMPLLLVFVTSMVWFARPSWKSPATWAVVIVMLAVVISKRQARGDLSLFLAGAGLGVFLEYWGTSRECWTYWTKETPPLVAACAHGFASVTFQRTLDVLVGLLGRSRREARAVPLEEA